MKSIAHISDLHFGRTDDEVLEGLKRAVVAAEPDVVVVSGDLTQRARRREFTAARDFLKQLPQPQIAVPGNHDVPLYNVLRRWLTPLTAYRRYITRDLSPFYVNDEIAILGINTARALTFKNGRINRSQIAKACAGFARLPANVVRMVVTHHPFALPESSSERAVVGRAKHAMRAFADCKVDIVLSGHLHVSQAITSETLYAGSHAALLVQAGTAASSRRRDETNAFNLLHIENFNVTIERLGWQDSGFAIVARERFRRDKEGWLAEKL
ncbi:MAG TPA: metallophosphoesterase family protein [Rhizomicrobium sp.]|jgi:3',5'-cyclic AMP phosphodiesterase CpdA|nr:metallophosphoesterase family protein [Rhizomicrobium sp.]